MKKKLVYIYFFSLLIFSYSQSKLIKYSRQSIAMGTFLEITFFYKGKDGEKILDELYEKTSHYEKLFSSRIEDGQIYKLNLNKNMEMPDLIIETIKEGIYYNKITNGAFDITLGNLIELWNVENNKKKPEIQKINQALLHSGSKYLNIINNRVLLNNQIKLDLGGIAKGKILKLLSNDLKEKNINDFLINGGGDLVLSGTVNNSRKWTIAITNPYNKNEYIGYIQLSDISIVTSGDYERFFIDPDDGKRYHHIIDPKTGFPAISDINSVTVICKDPVQADSFSTAFFVMGKEKTVDFIKNKKDIAVILISKKDNKIDFTVSDNINYQFDKKQKLYKFILTSDIKDKN